MNLRHRTEGAEGLWKALVSFESAYVVLSGMKLARAGLHRQPEGRTTAVSRSQEKAT